LVANSEITTIEGLGKGEMGICLTHQAPIPSMRGWKTILGT
jgi:hypothetical protein